MTRNNDIISEISAAFPRARMLFLDRERGGTRTGFGVEIDGVRNAWLFADTPENWQAVKDKALEWLNAQSAKPT